MNKCTILLFAVLFYSCQNQSEKNTTQPDSTDLPKKIVASNAPDSVDQNAQEPIRPPDKDEAETLVARYYSTRNQELNYPFYKGLGLNIMEIKRIPGTDSFLVSAKVNGRKWPNPNKDTLTFPFEENKNIRAFKNGALWQGDSIGIK
jgi:hypothetical protein